MDKIKKSKMEKKQIEMQLSGPEARMRRKLMESAILQDQGVPPIAPSRLQPMAPEPPTAAPMPPQGAPMKKGGSVKKYSKGGSTASKRADGCATKGKTKGRFI
jgi:hypothetical protein